MPAALAIHAGITLRYGCGGPGPAGRIGVPRAEAGAVGHGRDRPRRAGGPRYRPAGAAVEPLRRDPADTVGATRPASACAATASAIGTAASIAVGAATSAAGAVTIETLRADTTGPVRAAANAVGADKTDAVRAATNAIGADTTSATRGAATRAGGGIARRRPAGIRIEATRHGTAGALTGAEPAGGSPAGALTGPVPTRRTTDVTRSAAWRDGLAGTGIAGADLRERSALPLAALGALPSAGRR
jgi:hypothetical protein